MYFAFVEIDVPNACKTHCLGVLRGFGENGVHVDAIVPRPKFEKPVIRNVSFRYIWPWRFSKVGTLLLKVLLFFWMFVLSLVRKYDAIYVRELENNPVPRLISSVFRIPLFIEINDLLPEYFQRTGHNSHFVDRVEYNQVKDFKHACGLIVANSTYLKARLEKRFAFVATKTHLVMNGAHEIVSIPLNRDKALLKLGFESNGLYIGFVGTIYDRFDLITPIAAVIKLSEKIKNIHLLIIGDGPDLANLKAYVKANKIEERVTFFGYIHDELLPDYLVCFDIAIIPLTKYATETYGSLPTKFATYASHKLPVVTTKSDLRDYPAEMTKWIATYRAEETNDFCETITELYKNVERRKMAGQALNRYFQKHMTWKEISRKIVGIIVRNAATYPR